MFAHVPCVDVRASAGGWIALKTVPAGATSEVGQVIDQGDVWTFRFSYGGHQPVELELTRRELLDADWRVEVPEELEENLREEEVPLPP